jgi:methionyl-tRNA formyltransferase
MKIIFYGYRDWAFDIFKNLELKDKFLITTKEYSVIKKINPDLIFFVGWSDIVPKHIIENYTCVCLHPSPLPKYRGGTPIQHQLINGETESAVTLFLMDNGIDTGDILTQFNYSLDGDLDEIFQKITTIGTYSITHLIENWGLLYEMKRKQDDSQATTFKRLKPSDSKINPEDFDYYDAEYFYNKIRGLNDPYPNAYITCKDGKKLYIITTKL